MTGALLQGGAMLLFLALGAVLPRSDQPVLGRHTWVNLATGALMFGVRVSLVSFVAARSELGLLPTAWLVHPAFELLFAFLLLDFTRYWVHRLDHRVPLLWSFHRVHHSSEALDSTSGLRMHSNGHGYEVPPWRVVDIDTPEDWQRAELMARAL